MIDNYLGLNARKLKCDIIVFRALGGFGWGEYTQLLSIPVDGAFTDRFHCL